MKKFCSIVKLTFLTNFAYIKAFWLNIIGTAVSVVWSKRVDFYRIDVLY